MDSFCSSPVAPSASSSLPNDGTAGVALPPPSSSSSMLDLSLASGKAFMASPATSSCETLSPSFSVKVSTAPVLSADMIQTRSGAPFQTHPPQPDTPSFTAGLNSSALLLDLPSSVLPVKEPLPVPLEMSSSEVAAMSAETSSCSPVDTLERNLSSVLPSTCAPTDKNPSSPQISMSRTSSRSEFPPVAPSDSPGELSALSAPSESKPEMLTSSETRTLMDVPETETETDPSALSVPPPVGASTGLLPEHERSSLETSTSFPSVLKGNAVKRRRSADDDTNAQNLSKRFKKECRAGNPNCGLETGQSVLLGDHVVLACDICCTETGFCRECKCILCCKTIVPDAGECNFVRCVQRPSGDAICGHAAHVECALHSRMAGVVKKRGLDMEYLCRRCDNKTDLRELVTLLLEAIGNTELRIQAAKSLGLALELMKGTERGGTGARVLETLVETALRKVQGGVDITEVFRELKDQGAAAESARQHNLVRTSSLVEDVSQQPEASLDQWLQEGSPSSHPSPATPSSFTSPHMRSNPSVTSGQQNGTQYVDGSVGKHAVAEGHVGGPQSSPEVYPNDCKVSHLGSKPLIQNTGQVRGSHRVRAVSSNVNNNSHEAISDSYTARAWGNHMGEPSLRDGKSSQLVGHNSNSGMKKQKDQRNPSSGGLMHREDTIFTEICRSCGTVRRHMSNALEVTSSRRIPKIEDGRKKILQSPFTPSEEEPGDSDNYKHVAESDPGVDQSSRPGSTFSANASARKAIGTSLHLLDAQCERDVQDALQKLRQSQEAEYEHAKEHLNAQRESTMREYELLETTRMEFSEQPLSSSLEAFDELLLKTANQFTKTVEERETFKIMLKVAEGFGSFSKDHLSKFYRWPPAK